MPPAFNPTLPVPYLALMRPLFGLDHQVAGASLTAPALSQLTCRVSHCAGVAELSEVAQRFRYSTQVCLAPLRDVQTPTRGSVELTHEMAVASFKVRGWYLDDLVLTPVNHLTRRERKAKCRAP